MTSTPLIIIEKLTDAKSFLKVAEPILYSREAEYSLITGVAELSTFNFMNARSSDQHLILFQDLQPVGAALISDKNLILTELSSNAIAALIDFILKENIKFPAVIGPKNTSQYFALMWAEKNNLKSILAMDQMIYQLEKVIFSNTIQPHPNQLVIANETYTEIVGQWLYEFICETLPHEPSTPDRCYQIAAKRIQKSECFLWLDPNSNQVLSMNFISRPTRQGQSISAVYTPPHHRKKGFASALVAHTSQWVLDHGKSFATLYADLNNPTSNKIYQDIGFRPVAPSQQYIFQSLS